MSESTRHLKAVRQELARRVGGNDVELKKHAKISESIIRDVDKVLYLPEISVFEINAVMKIIRNNKAPGDDNVPVELLRSAGRNCLNSLPSLFNECLCGGIAPLA